MKTKKSENRVGYKSRKELNDAVWKSLRNDSLRYFRRDLDKGLERCDRATANGSFFMGQYYAELERNSIYELCGALLELVPVHDTKPHFRLAWAEETEQKNR